MTASRYVDRERYFNELAQTSKEYILPYIERFRKLSGKDTVLEIGCGEGGLLSPFAENGCKVTGIDISEGKVENAKAFFDKRRLSGSFHTVNVLDDDTEISGKTFDIIIIHDVIEHIEPDYKERFMEMVGRYSSPDGIIYMGFPAWQMPFGGHQQTCSHKCAKLPFIHWLPLKAYQSYLRRCRENEGTVSELTSIYRSRMTVESFEGLCSKTGFEITDRTLWLINPHYKVKFRLFPLKMPFFLSAVPRVRNLFSTSCFYVLKKSGQDPSGTYPRI